MGDRIDRLDENPNVAAGTRGSVCGGGKGASVRFQDVSVVFWLELEHAYLLTYLSFQALRRMEK